MTGELHEKNKNLVYSTLFDIQNSYADYTRIGYIWNVIGRQKTLEWNELRELVQLTIDLKYLQEQIIQMWNTYHSQYTEITDKEECCLLNSIMFEEVCKEARDKVGIVVKKIFHYKHNKIDTPHKREIKEHLHIDWYTTIIDLYTKYGGNFPCSSYDIIVYFKTKWLEMTPTECNKLVDIFDFILGGISIDSISSNLNSWIRSNEPTLPPEFKFKIKIY
jgi:hypothetical protein